nr:zinc finger CW-type PWWP domain protein 1 isoform X9 [Peromyscus maniculatus bairdii]
MMATLQNYEESEKGTKKTFAPPTQKPHIVKPQPKSWKEETLGTSSPEAEAKPSRPKASSKKREQKTATEHGPSGGQEKKQKAQDKPAEKKGKSLQEKPTLTNAEFEEIFQSVLQKSLQECLGQCLIWVQCSSPKCEKWRQLRGGIDPSVLPDNWSCDQNPDLNYNRCDIPEETWTGCESDVAYASYVPGSIIWAKQYGYPWWPGMIESDPDLGEYFLFASHLDSLPSKYHVTYFGETVSRAWIPVSMLKNFQELSLELARVKKCKNKDYGQKLEAAIRMAHKAEQISVQERVNLFGFWSRYNGSDGSGEGKDLMVCEPSRPECCLEKEKDSEEEKEEKEEKKDPTLPRPKPAKIQTKKTKSRGPSGGPAGTSKEKTVKKSLGSESAVPPGPIMGGKEEQGNLDLDHPGPKKKFKTPESKASATELPKEKAIKTDSKCPAPPAPHGACPLGKEGPGPQEPLTQEAASFPPEDDGSSDLDLEQLMEDIGEAEERGESQQRDGSEEFLAGLFEE